MEKINISELLKDCPRGMELDCLMFEKPVKYTGLTKGEPYIITIKTPCGRDFYLTKEGYLYDMADSKCIIFPKGKTTWEGFVPPCEFKDGDIVAHQNHMGTWIGIYHEHDYLDESFSSYCCIGRNGKFWADSNNGHGYYETRLATKEEKAKLFDAIKENGYKWNSGTKTLEKLAEPNFKVGDRIKHKTRISKGDIVTEIKDTHYILNDELALPFTFQDEYELVPDKFDITTLKPFESRVLVRDKNTDEWRGQFFSHYDNNSHIPYICIGTEGINEYGQCIPFEGNEHLLGKTEDCIDFYKTWER